MINSNRWQLFSSVLQLANTSEDTHYLFIYFSQLNDTYSENQPFSSEVAHGTPPSTPFPGSTPHGKSDFSFFKSRWGKQDFITHTRCSHTMWTSHSYKTPWWKTRNHYYWLCKTYLQKCEWNRWKRIRNYCHGNKYPTMNPNTPR